MFSLFLLAYFKLLFAFSSGFSGANLVVSLETSDHGEHDGGDDETV